MSATIVGAQLRDIGGIARELGISPESIRAYERLGKIPPPQRTDSGRRIYTAEDVARVRAVQEANRKLRTRDTAA